NTSEAIAVSDDKILSYQYLAQENIPIPKTIIAPKIFAKTRSINESGLQMAIKTLGFPMIVIEAFGSFGEQVYIIHTEEELFEVVIERQGKSFMFVEFVTSSYGRDRRLHVVGKQVVDAMERHAADDFRANIRSGGTAGAYHTTKQEQDLAVAATKAIGADFAG